MEFDLYVITKDGMKLDLESPQLLLEERYILEVLKEQPFTIFGVLKKVKEKFKEELTHYKTEQILNDLKNKSYVEIRE